MFMPASIRPLKSRLRIRFFSASVRSKRAMNASSSRLNASRSAGEHSALHILFSRRPRRDRRRSKMLVSGISCIAPSGGRLRAPALAVGVDLARGLGVGHRADDGADLHLLVALDGWLAGPAVLLAPDQGDFAARLRELGLEHGDGEHFSFVGAVADPG